MYMAASSADPAPEATYATAVVSFDTVYRAEYARLVRTLLVLTGRRDVAEELAQDAFLVAHRKWRTVGAYERPDAWIRRVALNAAVSVARRRTTEARLLLRLGRERPPEPAWTGPTAEVWAAIRSLPARQAQVAALVLVEDRSIEETAAVLDCGEETVRTHLRRARMALAEKLAQNEEGAENGIA
jgi:RNA polymerase sigma-70 factor, ECF subfamily